MLRNASLMAGETYHIFNRGAHKQPLFTCADDYSRFLILLHLSNNSESILLRDTLAKYKYRGPTSGDGDVFSENVDKSLVEILGYSLMSNHFHLILRQKSDNGITNFMRKVCTGYAMYFNLKHEHSGTLFQGKFKSNHVNTDQYFNWIFAYVHLNPISLIESQWDEKILINPTRAQKFLDSYKYSSYYDFYTDERPERAILAYEEAKNYIEDKSDIQALLASFEQGSDWFTEKSLSRGRTSVKT